MPYSIQELSMMLATDIHLLGKDVDTEKLYDCLLTFIEKGEIPEKDYENTGFEHLFDSKPNNSVANFNKGIFDHAQDEISDETKNYVAILMRKHAYVEILAKEANDKIASDNINSLKFSLERFKQAKALFDQEMNDEQQKRENAKENLKKLYDFLVKTNCYAPVVCRCIIAPLTAFTIFNCLGYLSPTCESSRLGIEGCEFESMCAIILAAVPYFLGEKFLLSITQFIMAEINDAQTKLNCSLSGLLTYPPEINRFFASLEQDRAANGSVALESVSRP